MTDAAKAETPGKDTDVDVAEHAERQQAQNQPDPFPEEGTDDKTVQGPARGDQPLSEGEALRATRAVIAAGLSGGGRARADSPDETLDDGKSKRREPRPGL